MKSHVRTTGLVLFAAALAAPASAQDIEPIRIALRPAAAPTPALRYHLLPQLYEMRPGNAAELYKQAVAEMKRDRKASADGVDLGDVDDWLERPAAELPRGKARKLVESYREVFRLADRAARSEYCDWGIAERIRKMGIAAVIPEVQDMRGLARLLALRARLDVVEDHTGQAVRDLQTSFAAAKHVGESSTLIGTLVGVALGTITAKELELLLARPQAPNLYWALTDLPRPFLDMRKALEGERIGIYGTFPGLLEAVNNPDAPPMRPEQVQAAIKLLAQEFNVGKDYPTRAAVALLIRAKHKAAKEALVAAGWPRGQVERMPHVQVALLHSLREYERLFDETRKWQTFPYAEAKKGFEQAERMVRKARTRLLSPAGDTPALPLATLLLPAVHKVFAAHARIDRRLAALRCVEAIRLYAAAHGGRLPARLEDIKGVPVPADPYLGRPFVYRLGQGGATLEGPPPAGEKANAGNALRYELVVGK